MGWNQGWNIMEHQIIGLYDLDVLSRDACIVVLKPFYRTDADSGDWEYLNTKDGKMLPQVAVEIIFPDFKVTDIPPNEHDKDEAWYDENEHAEYAYYTKFNQLIDNKESVLK